MFAVITTGGKQYKVVEQDIIFVEKLEAPEGAEVTFPVAALSTDAGFKVGTPVVEGATVTGKVLKNGKAIKDDETFSVTCLATYAPFAPFLEDESRAFTPGEDRVKDVWLNYARAGNAVLAQPEQYITLK